MILPSFNTRLAFRAWPLLLLVLSASAAAAPRVPQRPDEVLAKLPSSVGVRPWTEGRAATLLEDPRAAAAAARVWIEQGRAELDPRDLGRAQAVLGRWWNLASPPAEIRLLRASIRQSLHDFSGALADLDAVTGEEPGNAQAWLTKSTLHTLRGEWPAAREAALRLAPLTGRLTSAAAAAAVASVNGQLEEARELLQAAMRDDRGASADSIRLWSLTLLGEMAERLGRDSEAERWFRSALSMRHRDAYLLGAYGDFLLSAGRASDVVSLLRDETRADGLLLRLALAETIIDPRSAELARHRELLQERFASARARGDRIHQREESRFHLHALRQPVEALRFAQENWNAQKEPADVKILLEAGMAAGHSSTVNQVRQWLRDSGLQDVRVERMLSSFAAMK
ncbi:MAG: hypothetical protein HYR88_17835 [Verrucomicrobia bacterium]|nr:hypothetical protein [Verrucomicrobiota bacterium]MBI3868788.1 hypothetical protein [Verrucomicrobiota bacterium]